MSSQRGFSLIEILVAFSMLALAMGVLMQIFSGSLRNTDLARESAEAVALAESLLVSAGVETPLREGKRSGEYADRYRWQLSLQRMADTRPLGGGASVASQGAFALMELTVRIEWGGERQGTSPHGIELSTLRLTPVKP